MRARNRKKNQAWSHVSVLTLVGVAMVGVAIADPPAPIACSDIVERLQWSDNAPAEGGTCFKACVATVYTCVQGSTFENCNVFFQISICMRGAWRDNGDGTWACIGFVGYSDVPATGATGSVACGSGGGEGEL